GSRSIPFDDQSRRLEMLSQASLTEFVEITEAENDVVRHVPPSSLVTLAERVKRDGRQSSSCRSRARRTPGRRTQVRRQCRSALASVPDRQVAGLPGIRRTGG